jgi:hypothetical protein
MLERFAANVALWRPDSSALHSYTHVVEPAALFAPRRHRRPRWLALVVCR